MARPGELVELLARLSGQPPATVFLHSRNLRESGLRATDRRGRGSGQMSAADAVNLLLAVYGSIQPKESAKAVQDYGSLYATSEQQHLGDVGLTALSRLRREHSFSEALVSLVVTPLPETVFVKVVLRWPWPLAEIRAENEAGAVAAVTYGPGRIGLGRRKTNLNWPSNMDEMDFEQERSFGTKALHAIHKLLEGQQP